MNIYIDILFLQNFAMNFIILYTVKLIIKVKHKILRIALSSTIGSLSTIIYYFIMVEWYYNFLIKIIVSIVMLYIAFSPKNPKEMIKNIIFFYLISFTFGGAALSIIYITNYEKINIKNGILIGKYTILTIFLGVLVALIIIYYSFKLLKKKISKKDLNCNIQIIINNKNVNVKAFIDTGNFLKEPITNLPVIVVEKKILSQIVSKEILNNTEKILGGDLEVISENVKNEYMSKLKVIPFSSLGKENGMLLGIKADKVIVEKDEMVIDLDKVIIGICNNQLNRKGEYNALIGVDIINK